MSKWNDRLQAEIMRLRRAIDSFEGEQIALTATMDWRELRPGVTRTVGILLYKEVELHVEDHEGRSIGTFFLRFDYEGNLLKGYYEEAGVRIALTKDQAQVAYTALIDPAHVDYEIDL